MLDKNLNQGDSTAKQLESPAEKPLSRAVPADLGGGRGIEVACFPACAIPPVPPPPVAVPVTPAGINIDSALVRGLMTPSFGRYALRKESPSTGAVGSREPQRGTEASGNLKSWLSSADFGTSGYLKAYQEGFKSWGKASLLGEVEMISKQLAGRMWSGGDRLEREGMLALALGEYAKRGYDLSKLPWDVLGGLLKPDTAHDDPAPGPGALGKVIMRIADDLPASVGGFPAQSPQEQSSSTKFPEGQEPGLGTLTTSPIPEVSKPEPYQISLGGFFKGLVGKKTSDDARHVTVGELNPQAKAKFAAQSSRPRVDLNSADLQTRLNLLKEGDRMTIVADGKPVTNLKVGERGVWQVTQGEESPLEVRIDQPWDSNPRREPIGGHKDFGWGDTIKIEGLGDLEFSLDDIESPQGKWLREIRNTDVGERVELRASDGTVLGCIERMHENPKKYQTMFRFHNQLAPSDVDVSMVTSQSKQQPQESATGRPSRPVSQVKPYDTIKIGERELLNRNQPSSVNIKTITDEALEDLLKGLTPRGNGVVLADGNTPRAHVSRAQSGQLQVMIPSTYKVEVSIAGNDKKLKDKEMVLQPGSEIKHSFGGKGGHESITFNGFIESGDPIPDGTEGIALELAQLQDGKSLVLSVSLEKFKTTEIAELTRRGDQLVLTRKQAARSPEVRTPTGDLKPILYREEIPTGGSFRVAGRTIRG